jgi:hypothetical protein
MSLQLPGAPAPIAGALDRLKDELSHAAGQNLAGLILYGGLARGRYRPGKSDVNVLVLLHDASAMALAAVAPALRTARRAAGVDPLLLTPTEVARAAGSFPTKFLDIKKYHVVLAGVDPFIQLEVTREQSRRQVEQELRNLLLRTRRRYVIAQGDGLLLSRALARAARPLALQLEALLQLSGKETPSVDRTADIFATAASVFGLNGEPLARLAELRQHSQPVGDLDALYRGVLEAIARADDAAEQMKESSP